MIRNDEFQFRRRPCLLLSGSGGLGSAVLGKLADLTSIEYVFKVCAFLPLIGMITGFLPNIEGSKRAKEKA